MAQTKVQVQKVSTLYELFSELPSENVIRQYTPRDLAFAPIKPRLVHGKYGVTLQLVQFANGQWRQVSSRIQNVDYLARALAEGIRAIANAVELGLVDNAEVLQALQASKAYLQDAIAEIERALQSQQKANTKHK